MVAVVTVLRWRIPSAKSWQSLTDQLVAGSVEMLVEETAEVPNECLMKMEGLETR